MRKGAKRKAAQKPKSKEEETNNEPSQAVEESQQEPSQAVEEDTKPEENANRSDVENGKELSEPAAEENNKEASEPVPAAAAADKPTKRGGKRPAKATKQGEKAPPAKRARVVKPEAVTEYFEEKRNLEDLWKEVFPVGTEWDQLDLVYRYKWNFQNLEESFEEGGELFGKKVYLFGCTEPQMVFLNGEGKITIIPVVVAVVSPFPPSDKIGINSVQREAEEIIPMKQMKMDWVPYIPLEHRDSLVERFKSHQIFILGCTQRRAGLKHLKIERVKKFEYCLPYFYHPFQEDELEQSTIVQLLYPIEPKPVFCEFDWELDELEEFTDKLIEEEELDADQKDAFKDFVKEKVREAKKANREAREARKKALQEMSEDKKAAFQNMKFLKFYPVQTSDTPDISNVKSPFINRYYGKAHKVL